MRIGPSRGLEVPRIIVTNEVANRDVQRSQINRGHEEKGIYVATKCLCSPTQSIVQKKRGIASSKIVKRNENKWLVHSRSVYFGPLITTKSQIAVQILTRPSTLLSKAVISRGSIPGATPRGRCILAPTVVPSREDRSDPRKDARWRSLGLPTVMGSVGSWGIHPRTHSSHRVSTKSSRA
ncbi:hypothetical protein PAXRUDRAFT_271408 [Paxillus rubicundulus Ve08.2h10]|uniref:Uncharacterized protein n=1 Tax=Paxillus rubicundulus Ve08.2h10 TaxID=930991 RepID=A0A0D0ED18_9AGAM|nr:hypothetical protein PAXRUDRAFT_271408 [Paxillus rubicundulus Ve08.2h10]